MAKIKDPARLREQAARLVAQAQDIERAEREAARSELDRRVASLARWLTEADSLTVVRFTKQFVRNGRIYHYAAIKVNGRWSTTGPHSPKDYTSLEFADWLMGRLVNSGWAVTDLSEFTATLAVKGALV